MRYLFPLSPYNQQRQFEKPAWVYPCHLAAYATYLRNEGHEVVWDSNDDDEVDAVFHEQIERKVIENDFQIDVPFERLPFPDRKFTDAKNPRWQKYGNYRCHPATHMMVSNLCWYGLCSFCVDTFKLENGEKRGVRSVDHVMEEIDDLIENGYKEVFDDSGTFPVGIWLEEFHRKMKIRKKHIRIGVNMKPIKMDYKLLADSGVGFTLVGIESANQYTVDKIKKGQKSEDIIPIMKSMSDAGLKPHVTFMTTFPWESEEEEKKTIELAHHLLRKGYAKTLQVSIYSPPRTKPGDTSIGHKRVPLYYDVYKHPEFWYHKIKDMSDFVEFKYMLRGGRLVFEEHWRKKCHALQLKYNSFVSSVRNRLKY